MGFESIDHVVRHKYSGCFFYDGSSYQVIVRTFHDISNNLRENKLTFDGDLSGQIRDEELIEAILDGLREMGHDI